MSIFTSVSLDQKYPCLSCLFHKARQTWLNGHDRHVFLHKCQFRPTVHVCHVFLHKSQFRPQIAMFVMSFFTRVSLDENGRFCHVFFFIRVSFAQKRVMYPCLSSQVSFQTKNGNVCYVFIRKCKFKPKIMFAMHLFTSLSLNKKKWSFLSCLLRKSLFRSKIDMFTMSFFTSDSLDQKWSCLPCRTLQVSV